MNRNNHQRQGSPQNTTNERQMPPKGTQHSQNPYRPIMQQPYTPPPHYPTVRHKSRRKARRASLLALLSVIILAMLVVSMAIFVTRCASGSFGEPEQTGQTTPLEGSGSTSAPIQGTTVPTETTAETVAVEALYTTIEKTAADVHKGYLILVNYQNAYDFNGGFNLKPIYGNKNRSYKVRDTLVQLDEHVISRLNDMMAQFEADTGKHDILTNSTFRTYEEQEALYAMRVEQHGEQYAASYVAMPGYSEHHTGLATDFTFYTDEQVATTFEKNPEYVEWLNANAHKFGFIQRYPADKTDITKIAYEDWHYRYIGKPHAYYIAKNRICLEEYIEQLRKTSYSGEHIAFTDDEGIEWEVYFAPASGDTTEIKVPKYQDYEISGNNVDGFIITVRVR